MATTDTSADALFEHRLSMIIEQGFNMEDSITLAKATKVVTQQTSDRTYEYEVPVSWHDVARLIAAGATKAQIVKILG